MGVPGQVDHRIHAAKGFGPARVRADIGNGVPLEPLMRRRVGGTTTDGTYVVSGLKQLGQNMAANEAGGTGEEDFHGGSLLRGRLCRQE